MTRFEIYNMNTGEDLGVFAAVSEDEALDVMAREYGFADYADCIREYGVSGDEAKAELQITRLADHEWSGQTARMRVGGTFGS